MSRRMTEIIEVAAFLMLAVLVVFWAWSQDGRYEPWTAVCGVVAGGLEIYRRFFVHDVGQGEGSPDDASDRLLSWLLANATSSELSETLPRALRLAQKLGDKDFEKWVRLELYGYNSENGMSETDVVPEYRAVPGRYLNAYGQVLRLDDPGLGFVNEDRFRLGVRELEGYAKKTGMLYILNEDMLSLVRQNFGFDAVQFGFNATAIIGILDAIRSRLIDRLHRIKDGLPVN